MKVGIIADDLTGANATGVLLSKNGFNSATVVFGGVVPTIGGFTSISVDTDSRYCAPGSAQTRVLKAYEQLSTWGASVFCKRIDSTVRGNLGVETDTLLDALGENSVAVVVTSYPDSGRILSGGYLLVDGVPVESTDVAKDPMNPITISHVPTIMSEQSQYPVSHIGLGRVLKGKNSIHLEMMRQIEAGNRIIVVDAVTNEEIDHIAESMAAIEGVIFVPVDPGPLSASYSRLKAHQHVLTNKFIVTVGSITPLTGRQLNYLIEKKNADPVYVNTAALASTSSTWEDEIERAMKEAIIKLEEQEVLIITTYAPGAGKLNLKEIAVREGVTEEILAKRLTEGLAKVTHSVIDQTEHTIDGMFSSGGDVTAALCSVSEAQAIGLQDEVLPLAAYGHFIGGVFDGIPVITKGGMVGDKYSIYKCVRFLTNKKEEGSV
ncbi:four-carbon acid sugar kinase family protein [Psychrobacillus psychrodurans]|uniref:four-carbon acid sugar kinase family protein n=1 Tax=Psychrobacillus psychrodurans TaxID=126157 RepID=UPI001F4D3E56|nr:four-carbon acid sugar kinase family protein [Psychrobacillus psychrodurans]MCK1998133.1 four-carbon acid sugar kinase family protein [Psychrobacillus psychrodurans]